MVWLGRTEVLPNWETKFFLLKFKMNTSIETSYSNSTCITLCPCSEAFVWTPPVRMWSLTRTDIQWGDQSSVADQRVSKAYRGECLQLIPSHCCVSEFWNSISAYINVWWTQMGFCPYIPNPVHTFRCWTLGTHIGDVHLALCLLFAGSMVTPSSHAAALLVLTFTHPILHFLHRPTHSSRLISQTLQCVM